MEKHTLIGPALFAVLGAYWAVIASMLFHYDGLKDGIDMNQCRSRVLFFSIAGAGIGYVITLSPRVFARIKPGIEFIAAVLLLSTMAATIGWFHVDPMKVDREYGLKWGAIIGALAGLAYGIANRLINLNDKPPLNQEKPPIEDSNHASRR